jgi:hypothetical protein
MKKLPHALMIVLSLTGCATADYDPFVAAVDSQLATRGHQTRLIESNDYVSLMTAVISTLQDYHFRIADIDPDLGTITAYQANEFRRSDPLSGRTALTVMVRQRRETTFSVRMNMTTGLGVEHEPTLYQQFFSALHRKLYHQGGA